MEVLKKNIHMYRQAKRAVSQITLEEDFNVPDVKPDVEQIVQNKAKTVVESTRSETGRFLLKGYVQVSILYMDDTDSRQIHRLDGRLNFDDGCLFHFCGCLLTDILKIGKIFWATCAKHCSKYYR